MQNWLVKLWLTRWKDGGINVKYFKLLREFDVDKTRHFLKCMSIYHDGKPKYDILFCARKSYTSIELADSVGIDSRTRTVEAVSSILVSILSD